jgi:hypothetical protein
MLKGRLRSLHRPGSFRYADLCGVTGVNECIGDFAPNEIQRDYLQVC